MARSVPSVGQQGRKEQDRLTARQASGMNTDPRTISAIDCPMSPHSLHPACGVILAIKDRKSTRLNSVTNAQLVCRLLLAKQQQPQQHHHSTLVSPQPLVQTLTDHYEDYHIQIK